MYDEIVRRSKLIVPVNNPEFVQRALMCGADTIVLDPRNSPPSGSEAKSRASLRKWFPLVAKSGADVFVLIKHNFVYADLEDCVWPGLDGIVFPKVESAAEILNLNTIITELERKRGIPGGAVQIDVIVQTARGIWNVYEIVNASARVVSVNIGFEDLAEELGIQPTDEVDQFAYAKGRIVVAAKSREDLGGNITPPGEFLVGIQPHGLGFLGVSARCYSNQRRWPKAARLGYMSGFRGSLCTDLAQVKPLNKGFSPTEEDVNQAKKVIEVMNAAMAQGVGSVSLGGEVMVNVRSLYPARVLLARVETINAKEKLKVRARRLMGKTLAKEVRQR